MKSEADDIAERYEARRNDLGHIARTLKAEFAHVLEGQLGIERIEFRVKAADSFVEKAISVTKEGNRRYTHPFEEIEDQVGGRVMAFYRSTIDEVLPKLLGRFQVVESKRKELPTNAFGYESHHLVFQIPPEAFPTGWSSRPDKIETFEMQVRTLFMHAWAELSHDVEYKKPPLSGDHQRELAWAAASAWGADQSFQRLRSALNEGDAGPMTSPAQRSHRPERF